MIYICFIGLPVQYLYARGSFFILVVNNFRNDGPWTNRQIACFHSRRQSRRLRAEISAKWTTQPAFITELTVGSSFQRFSNIRCSSNDRMSSSLELFF